MGCGNNHMLRCQHSGKTMSRHFTNILKAVSKLQHELIRSFDDVDMSLFLLQHAHNFLPWVQGTDCKTSLVREYLFLKHTHVYTYFFFLYLQDVI